MKDTYWIKRWRQSLYKQQNGICPICEKELPSNLVNCVLDHGHKTGEGRTLLHRDCNVFIGMIENHPNILESSMRYFKTHVTN